MGLWQASPTVEGLGVPAVVFVLMELLFFLRTLLSPSTFFEVRHLAILHDFHFTHLGHVAMLWLVFGLLLGWLDSSSAAFNR